MPEGTRWLRWAPSQDLRESVSRINESAIAEQQSQTSKIYTILGGSMFWILPEGWDSDYWSIYLRGPQQYMVHRAHFGGLNYVLKDWMARKSYSDKRTLFAPSPIQPCPFRHVSSEADGSQISPSQRTLHLSVYFLKTPHGQRLVAKPCLTTRR